MLSEYCSPPGGPDETRKKSSSALPDPNVIDAMILDSLMLNNEADTSTESCELPVIDPNPELASPSGVDSASGSSRPSGLISSTETVAPSATSASPEVKKIGEDFRAITTSPMASSLKTPVSKKKRKLSPDTRRQISIYDGYINAMKTAPMIQVTVDDDDGDDSGVRGDRTPGYLSSKKKKRRINPEGTSDVDSILPFSSQKTSKEKRRINLATKFRF